MVEIPLKFDFFIRNQPWNCEKVEGGRRNGV